MAQATADRLALYYSLESTWNETPSSPAMTQVPITGENLSHRKQTSTSKRIRNDRMLDSVDEVGNSADGGFDFELTYSDFEDFMACALGANWSTISFAGASNVSIYNTSIIKGAAGAFSGMSAGDWIKIASTTASATSGFYVIASWTSNILTLSSISAISLASATADSATIKTKKLKNGTTLKSALFEKNFADIAKFISYQGMRVEDFNLKITAREPVTGRFSFRGAKGVSAAATVSGSTAAYSSNPVFNAANNLGSIREGAAALSTAVREITFSFKPNLRDLPQVASKTPANIVDGEIDFSGTVDAYFEDLTLYNKFINHTNSSLDFRLTDGAAAPNVYIFNFPSIQYEDPPQDPGASGKNTDVMANMRWRAIREGTTTNCMMAIYSLAG